MHRIRNWRQRVPLFQQAAIDIARDTIGTGLNYAALAYQQYDGHRRIARLTHNLQQMPPTNRSNRGSNRGPTPMSLVASSTPTLGVRGRARSSTTAGTRPTRQYRVKFLKNARRRKRPSHVTALNRVARGPFTKKFKKVKISKFYGKRGCVSKQEFGASVSDPNAVYIGHGIATRQLVAHMARNIVKALYTKHGNEIVSWDIGPPFTASERHLIEVEHYPSVTSTGGVLSSTSDFVTGNTYAEIAAKLETLMITIAAANTNNITRWGIFTLFSKDGPTNDRRQMSQINMQRVHVEFEFISQLKVQNVTEAATGTGPNDDLVTSVEANPLIGKHYYRTNWKNGFDVHWRPGDQINWDGFYANAQTGVISTTATDSNLAGKETYNKPPPYFGFNATKGDGVKLQPGEIKTSFIKFKTHIMFQKLYDKTHLGWKQSTTEIKPVDFGSVKMVGLEKLLDSRLASDSNVTCQYEVMQQLKSTMVEVKQSTLPFVSIL